MWVKKTKYMVVMSMKPSTKNLEIHNPLGFRPYCGANMPYTSGEIYKILENLYFQIILRKTKCMTMMFIKSSI